MGIEIVERHGDAYLRVTTESEAARAWLAARSDDIRSVLSGCGLNLAGLDVHCRGRQGREGGEGERAARLERRVDSRPGPSGPECSQDELVG